jgi:Putative transposase
MEDTAAHLVDRVIPDVPVRQWVLSPPHALRYRIAYDSPLLAALVRIFIRAIFTSLRRRARDCGIPRGQCGAVAFVQRFGSALNLHPHVHVIVLDGVFARLERETPRFYPLCAPDDPDVAAVAETTSLRTQALLTKKGIGASSDEEDEDPLRRDTPWLAGLYAHGVRGRFATGPNAGMRVTTWGGSGEAQEPEPSTRRCANVDGFSVHASVSLPAHRREQLENLCRYMLRPPLAVERLERLASGRLAYRMKTPWRDGTTHVVMSDGELVEKLASLVPAPRFHLVRYFGILAPAAKQRASIVPLPPPASTAQSSEYRDTTEEQNPRPRNYTWAQLMARVFALDVFECPRCGSQMRMLVAIEDPVVARKILDRLGLPSRPPPVAPARRNPQSKLTEL